MEKIKAFLYGSNKTIAFVMSCIMSFLFYSSLAGSNLFFFWFNGIFGIVADVKRVQLWDDGKRMLASMFIALSVIAFVGSSVSETLKASYRETNSKYVKSLEDNIAKQSSIIEIQEKRIKDTPDNMAPEKETRMLNEALMNRDLYQKELLKYETENVADESMTQFQIIADKTGVDVRIIIWVFFIIRAILLEVSVLYDSKKKTLVKQPSYTEKKFEIDEEKRTTIFDWIKRWKEKATADNKSDVIGRLNSLTEYVEKLEDFSKGEMYVREDPEHDSSSKESILWMEKRKLFPWIRNKE